MKLKTFSIILAALATMAPGLASAVSIAVIRANDVVTQSPQYEAAENRMRADFEQRGEQLQSEARQLEQDIRSFAQEADMLAPADRERREQELTTRQNDFQLKQQQFREDVANRERELFEEIMEKIRVVIERIARERELDLILPDAVYAAPQLDLTEIVLRELQKDN